jgi:hypothetical protein
MHCRGLGVINPTAETFSMPMVGAPMPLTRRSAGPDTGLGYPSPSP